jgi:hypothetical protein
LWKNACSKTRKRAATIWVEGSSCDWDRQRFTLDDICAKAVCYAFFNLFKKGLIYRGKRLVNWDTHLHTAVAVHPEDERYKKFIGKTLRIIKRGKTSPRSNRPSAHHRKQWAFYAIPSSPDLMANRAYAIRPYNATRHCTSGVAGNAPTAHITTKHGKHCGRAGLKPAPFHPKTPFFAQNTACTLANTFKCFYI